MASCLWICAIFFGRFQHHPVNGCSTVSCDFCALPGGDLVHVLLLHHPKLEVIDVVFIPQFVKMVYHID